MPKFAPDEKCPHGVQRGHQCDECTELIRKYVVPRKFGPETEINLRALSTPPDDGED